MTRQKFTRITAYNYEDYKYELQIKYHTKGRGNIHTYSLSKYEFDDSDWIYTNIINGRVDASDLIFTHHQRRTESPWKQSELRGYVQFSGDTLAIIALEMPLYNDSSKVDHWEKYEFNGTYSLTVKNEKIPLIEKY
jgi:hypothetical protein